MNTAATKFPRVFRASLLLRDLPPQAKPVDRPFSPRQTPALDRKRTLPPTEIRPKLSDLAVLYRVNRLLAFYFTVDCLTQVP
jgi:hypothetical protein